MFTGIITHMGSLDGLKRNQADVRMRFRVPAGFLADCNEGDSIAVSGVCLTALQLENERFSADVSGETLACTTLGGWMTGRAVNLELSLKLSDRLGGHLVSGHVDGRGVLVSAEAEGESQRLVFRMPVALSRYVAVKGSICIDGVSLTVNEIAGIGGREFRFGVNIIPHTMAATSLGKLRNGDEVNLEVDTIARYVERMYSEP